MKIEVKDEREPCLSHSGSSLRGDFSVFLDGKRVWSESDTWQSADEAESTCLRLASLLHKVADTVRKESRKR